MELFAEALSVVGAMVLSVSFGLLVEELLFGGLVRLFFTRRPVAGVVAERRVEVRGRVRGRIQERVRGQTRGEGEEKCLR